MRRFEGKILTGHEIDSKCEQLAELRRQFRVRRFAVFGSALREGCDSAGSDVDFLVQFEPLPPGEYVDAYFGLLGALESLYGRPVDLVVESAI